MVAGGDEEQADGAIRLVDARDGQVSAELDTGLALVGRALAADGFRESALYDAAYVRRFREAPA